MPAIPAGIEALIFDFDGTLADTTASHEQALRAALRTHGIALDRQWYRRHVGLSIRDLLAALPAAQHLPHEEIIQQSRTHLLAAMHSLAPIPCTVSLLHAARHAGLPCAVASGASRVLVDPGIDALGLRGQLAALVVREDVACGKPAADLYLAAAQRLGVPPGRCLAVDDALDGLTSARTAGMRVLTVIDGHVTPADPGPKEASRIESGRETAARGLGPSPGPRTHRSGEPVR